MDRLNEEQCIALIKQGLRIKELRDITLRNESYLRSIATRNNLTISRSKKEPAKDAKEKQCTDCKKTLQITEFYKQVKKENNKEWEYYDSSCKECRSTYSIQRRRNIKIQALEYKGWSCNKCGLVDKEYPQIYDFHHLDPTQKDFSISKNVLVFDKIKNELDKCIVLCSNCHRREHAESI